jgi:hypothetical protein
MALAFDLINCYVKKGCGMYRPLKKNCKQKK